MAYLLDVVHSLSPFGPIKTVLPKTMESVGQNYGFLLYRTQIPQKFANTDVELEILGLRDRGIILVGQVRELFLFTICDNLKELSHHPGTLGRREPWERGCSHIKRETGRG